MEARYNTTTKKFEVIPVRFKWLKSLFASRAVVPVFGFSGTVGDWRKLSRGFEMLKNSKK